MELKQVKPIHFRCPKCGYDFAYNSSYVERNIDKLKCEIADILAQLERFKEQNPNPKSRRRNPWYNSARKALAEKQKDLSELKNNRKVAAQEAKLQVFEIFKQKIIAEIGRERFMELIEESESEIVYNIYDTAKQTHNNFNGV